MARENDTRYEIRRLAKQKEKRSFMPASFSRYDTPYAFAPRVVQRWQRLFEYLVGDAPGQNI